MGQITSIVCFDESLIAQWLHPIDVIRVRPVCRSVQYWSHHSESAADVVAFNKPWRPNSLAAIRRVVEVMDQSNNQSIEQLREDVNVVEPFIWPIACMARQSINEHQLTLAHLRALDLSLCLNNERTDLWETLYAPLPHDCLSKLFNNCSSLTQLNFGKIALEQADTGSTYNAILFFPHELQQLTLISPPRLNWHEYQQLQVLTINNGDELEAADGARLGQLPHLKYLSIACEAQAGIGTFFSFLDTESVPDSQCSGLDSNLSPFRSLQHLQLFAPADDELTDDCVRLLSTLSSPLVSVNWSLMQSISHDVLSQFLRPTSTIAATLQRISFNQLSMPLGDVYDLLAELPHITAVNIVTTPYYIPGPLQPPSSLDRNLSALSRFLDTKRDQIEELSIRHALTVTERVLLWPTIAKRHRLKTLEMFETQLPLMPPFANTEDVSTDYNSSTICQLLDLRLVALTNHEYYNHSSRRHTVNELTTKLPPFYSHQKLLQSAICANLQTLQLGGCAFSLMTSNSSSPIASQPSAPLPLLPNVRNLTLEYWNIINRDTLTQLALLCPNIRSLRIENVTEPIVVHDLTSAFPFLTHLRCSGLLFISPLSVDSSIVSWFVCFASTLPQLQYLELVLHWHGGDALGADLIDMMQTTESGRSYFPSLGELRLNWSLVIPISDGYQTEQPSYPVLIQSLIDRMHQARPSLAFFIDPVDSVLDRNAE